MSCEKSEHDQITDFLDQFSKFDPDVQRELYSSLGDQIARLVDLSDSSDEICIDPFVGEEEVRNASITDWMGENLVRFESFNTLTPYIELGINHLASLAVFLRLRRDDRFQINDDLVRRVAGKGSFWAVRSKTSLKDIPLVIKDDTIIIGDDEYMGEVFRISLREGRDEDEEELGFRDPRLQHYTHGEWTSSCLTTTKDEEGKYSVRERYEHAISPDVANEVVEQIGYAIYKSELNIGKQPRDSNEWRVVFVEAREGKYTVYIDVASNSATHDRRPVQGNYAVVFEGISGEDFDALEEMISATIENGKGDNDFCRQVLYYLLSTLYFGSDPEMPYLPGHINPRHLDASLADYYHLDMRQPGSAREVEFVRKVLNERGPEGLSVVGGLSKTDLSWVRSELNEVFPNSWKLYQKIELQIRDAGEAL